NLGPHREDMRKVPFFTIDGETARDFDDAIHVERERSGYVLWVAIADVSHYVREGSELDKCARGRGTSVYFPERAFHMLPSALSEHLCSLKPNEPRLALVSKIQFDREGNPGKTTLHETVIESTRRATYTEIETEWKANRGCKDWALRPHFELFELLKFRRLERGALDLDLPEAEIKVDEQGEPVSILRRERWDSHRLIEEFMIAANEAVSRWMIAKTRQFLFRVHEQPDETAFEKFATMAAAVGAHYKSKSFGNREVAAFLKSIAGRPTEQLLNYALLRSLKQARYNPENLGHFGLASTAYTHFTSPIRRYPDLVVHRLLRETLRGGGEDQANETRAHIKEIAEHCNYRERLAADAERESIKIKQVRALAKHLGSTLAARISGMNPHGIYAQTLEPWAEGWISVERLPGGESFRFDEEKMVYYAKRSKMAFLFGDPIKVKVVRFDIGLREVELDIAGSDFVDPGSRT
ncbi:MAG: VacB/RNase II family 3'-5' exoribonuclease, partial [Bdellovibrionota bacterium]